MCDAEKECLGYEDRQQLDWFRKREVDTRSDGGEPRPASRNPYSDYMAQQLMCVRVRTVCMRVCDNHI